MKFDPDRIKAIVELKSPTNIKQLQIILGMINYLKRFVPGLAELATSLLKKDVTCLWTAVNENAYVNIKNCMSQAPVLQNFNSKLPVTIQ